MKDYQAIAAFIGVFIGFIFAFDGLAGMFAMFRNENESHVLAFFWSVEIAFGITLIIAILKPI